MYLTNKLPVSLEGSYQENHNKTNFEQVVNELEVTADLKDLLKSILDRDPRRRPTFREILKSEWFAGKVDEVFSTETGVCPEAKKAEPDFIQLKPIIQAKARTYFNKENFHD